MILYYWLFSFLFIFSLYLYYLDVIFLCKDVSKGSKAVVHWNMYKGTLSYHKKCNHINHSSIATHITQK